jgi:hypothetical protein
MTIPNHLSHEATMACERTPSIDINLNIWNGIVRVVPNKGRVPMHVWAGKPGSEGGVGGGGDRPN